MLIYRLLMTILAAKELATRLWAGDRQAVRARLGLLKLDKRGDRIWLHAASNGELASVRPVIDALLAQGRRLLITVNTDSALEMAAGWELEGADICLAPIDLPGPTRRVLRNWQITAHVTLESDLWPIRILNTPGPVLVLGGRLTARSAKGWARLHMLVRRMLARVTYLSAQDSASAERFAQAGLLQAAQGPVFDLKALYKPPQSRPDAALEQCFDRAETWLAASTHDGEEDIILAAHTKALKTRPALKLIIAPRHPNRANEISRLIESYGLTYARRSSDDNPVPSQVYLADTLGEMHLWYALAGTTFVAGSLTDRGGHTPYEPAAFGSAILHGPDTSNFLAAYERLTGANAARCTLDADALCDALLTLDTAEKQAKLGQAAQKVLHQDTDLKGLLRDITTALDA
ncbi:MULTISPECIES: 3-deoxy-D-manno-octulosonic acid transferase [Marivita]|uniref:3-deoxy-D-manno-octulosonic acid transferase n=1 Tax=Marivita cryptomonadis TaxID=505252 RepID=A0A9Q2PAI1_9RHOB|nr:MULTISPECIES: glycosyltransferase N-terminal domain-containing protein [Marivita]MCR9166645.1 3-deoxy-D-manno-octulosonic acid transferase [Paracoccaceae bacterium]MBM2321313.1 3-deoxy-D-manno-octulosonic acid transferase [Marivita cryptomonadis]MBM2330894.1 3-deoxy-D-manno-octulosonic acid transferase [Marivita cryptomonadis]MBM2340480.1 3-deoxy-D-manno-octulosonic acid transferase [Marivita cryptomonadis]MBM2345142.1 3-deoxy-D-manno-octulosonic acid transferase [Marivita cryptomonadis]